MEDALVGSFRLAVGLRVSDRGEVESDVVFLAELGHGSFGEVGAVVRDDAIWEPVAIYELAQEFSGGLPIAFPDWFVLHPLCEFVDRDQEVGVARRSLFEGAYH